MNGHVAVGTNEGEIYIRKSLTEISTPIYYEQISKDGPNGWIEVVRYSPCGKYLAVGSHDRNIYIMQVNENYKTVAICNKHRSFITSIDWSCDSQYIQSNCGAYEYLFFNAMNGQQLTCKFRRAAGRFAFILAYQFLTSENFLSLSLSVSVFGGGETDRQSPDTGLLFGRAPRRKGSP